MAVKPLANRSSSQCGFTLIESVVAMGLFAGAVFMLISVFNDFMLDNYPAKCYQAVALAQEEISGAEIRHDLSDAKIDTLGYRVTRTVYLKNSLIEIEVAVKSARLPSVSYAKITKIWPEQ